MKEVHEYGLTEREYEILGFMIEGFCNPEIAQKIYVNNCTVKAHVSHIFEKMKVQNRIQAVVKALKENICI